MYTDNGQAVQTQLNRMVGMREGGLRGDSAETVSIALTVPMAVTVDVQGATESESVSANATTSTSVDGFRRIFTPYVIYLYMHILYSYVHA